MINDYCAFSTCDDKYAVKAIVSLLSIRKWKPDIALFLIGREFSSDTKRLLKKYNIKPIEKKFDQIFHTAWGGYPLECYYMFVGPELLHEKGFNYSLYIDGDIYCNKNPFDFDLSKIKDMAGAYTKGSIQKILDYGNKNDSMEAVKLFGNADELQKPRVQTGVVFFNNASMVKKRFLNKIGLVYQTAIDNNIPRKGDDSLLGLFKLAYPKWDYLEISRNFNVITSDRGEGVRKLRLHVNMINDAVFFHFNKIKPWASPGSYPTYAYEYFYHKWRQYAVDSLSAEELSLHFPSIYKNLKHGKFKFYWDDHSKKFNDVLVPYMLKKYCGVNNLEAYNTNNEDIRVLDHIQKSKAVHHRLRRLVKRRKPNGAMYASISGNLTHHYADGGLIYGGGVSNLDQYIGRHYIKFVRGPITRHRLLLLGYQCPPIYAEPAFLLPSYFNPKVQKKYKFGVIVATTIEYERISKKYVNTPDIQVVNMENGEVETIIKQILSCQKIVSSSLYGIILCHAYKIPVRQIIYSRLNYVEIEFADYYSSLTTSHLEPISAPNYTALSLSKLNGLNYEEPPQIDVNKIEDLMFFNKEGIRKSVQYPFA